MIIKQEKTASINKRLNILTATASRKSRALSMWQKIQVKRITKKLLIMEIVNQRWTSIKASRDKWIWGIPIINYMVSQICIFSFTVLLAQINLINTA